MAKVSIDFRITFPPEENIQEEIPRFYRFFFDHNVTVLDEQYVGRNVIFSVECNTHFLDAISDLVDNRRTGLEYVEMEVDLKPESTKIPVLGTVKA